MMPGGRTGPALSASSELPVPLTPEYDREAPVPRRAVLHTSAPTRGAQEDAGARRPPQRRAVGRTFTGPPDRAERRSAERPEARRGAPPTGPEPPGADRSPAGPVRRARTAITPTRGVLPGTHHEPRAPSPRSPRTWADRADRPGRGWSSGLFFSANFSSSHPYWGLLSPTRPRPAERCHAGVHGRLNAVPKGGGVLPSGPDEWNAS